MLLLLQAYTARNQSGQLLAVPPTSSLMEESGISEKALETLSSEQISALVTSNSVNYEVIQQILTQQKTRPTIRGAASSASNGGRAVSVESEQAEMQQGDMSKTPSSLQSSMTDTNQQMQQLVQITPQQLQLLQSQVNDLLQSQHISLPPDLSPEQQQQLIQTLLLRQLHLQQTGGVANVSLKNVPSSSTGEGTNPLSKLQNDSNVTVAEVLRGMEQSSATSSGGSVKKEATSEETGGDKNRTKGESAVASANTFLKKVCIIIMMLMHTY